MSSAPLAGRVAVVTGASRGIGRSIAIALSRAGARVALIGRDKEALAQSAAEAAGDSAIFTADVTSEREVTELAGLVVARFGEVNILVNNAGMNIRKPVTDFTLEEWNLVMATNVTSAFLICRSFIPHMKGKGYGRILNLTSIMSHISLPGRAAYSASKAALLGLTRALALELAADNITAVGISPGPFATEMNTILLETPELNQQFLSRIPLGRWGKVQDLGELAVYLCSDAASFLTGSDIVIDGGWCAQ